MATMNVLNSTGGTEAVEKPLAPGRAAAAASRPVAFSTEDLAVLTALSAKLPATLGSTSDALSLPVTQSDEDKTAQFLIKEILGSLDDAAETSPVALSATIVSLIRGLHDLASKGSWWSDPITGAAIDITSEYVGQVGGTTPRVTAQMVRQSSATQYSIGDTIINSSSLVPIEFNVTRSGALLDKRSGRLSGCRCVVTAASGTIVLPAFNLYLFRPEANIPFAAGSFPADNAAFNVSAAAMKELVGIFQFRVDDWLNQTGAATAVGLSVYQAVPLKPLDGSGRVRAYAPFNLAALASNNLQGLMQAQNTWNPGAVVNTFDFALDVDLD